MTVPLMKNYIDGEWVASDSPVFGDVCNPARGEKIASVAYGTAADVDRAVAAAKEAFAFWRETPPLTRARYLFRLKGGLRREFRGDCRGAHHRARQGHRRGARRSAPG